MTASIAAALTNDSLSAWYELKFSSRMTLISVNLSKNVKERGSYIVDIWFHSIISQINDFDSIVCQQWRQHDISWTHWRLKLQNSSILFLILWLVCNSTASFIPPITWFCQLWCYHWNFRALFVWWSVSITLFITSPFFKVTSSISVAQANFDFHRNISSQFSDYLFHRLGCLLWRAVV